uniref:Uncharacterized protein n=1 Tax=Lactuca sativa TaxID=4236 RepID=A0A9R1WD60_LACSA|nr:hypothetical protein LSAT_V11C200056690 [Lactuca sativa]
MVKDTITFTHAQIAADRGHHHVSLILSNAHRAQNSCWKGKSWIKKIGDIGYAPILFCLVFVSTLIFIKSILFGHCCCWALGMDNCYAFNRVFIVGLWGWTIVTTNLIVLVNVDYCFVHNFSSKDPGYVNMSGGIKNNIDAEVCFISD